MTADAGSVAEIAHSCSICDHVVVNLTDRIQSHNLGLLGQLKQQAGTEQCELIREFLSVTKASPETDVELRLSRYRNRKNDVRAAIMRAGWDEDDEEQSQEVQYFHVYALASKFTGFYNTMHYSDLTAQMILALKSFPFTPRA